RRLGVGQICFRLGNRDLVIVGIDPDQDIASLHVLLVIGQHLNHVAADARADSVDVPVDLSVVGGLIGVKVLPQEVAAHQNKQDHDGHDDASQAAPAAARQRAL